MLISDVYPTKVRGNKLPWYKTWKAMHERCGAKVQDRSPSYIGCKVCDEWYKASNFKQWYDEHYNGGHLDKDLLGDGKLYSPETCCFVPQWLNNLLYNRCESRTRDLPQGVSRYRTHYRAQTSIDGKRKKIGTFKTPEDAFKAYAAAKRVYVESKREVILSLPRGDKLWAGVIRILNQQLDKTVSRYIVDI